MTSKLTIKIFLEPNGKCITKGKIGDAGFDAYACSANQEMIMISQFEMVKIPLGIRYAFWVDGKVSNDYYFEIANRSGVGTKEGLTEVARICDASYRGIPHYAVAKITPGITIIKHEQKVCQMMLHPFVDPQLVDIEIVNSIEELGTTDRGADGFGSTN